MRIATFQLNEMNVDQTNCMCTRHLRDITRSYLRIRVDQSGWVLSRWSSLSRPQQKQQQELRPVSSSLHPSKISLSPSSASASSEPRCRICNNIVAPPTVVRPLYCLIGQPHTRSLTNPVANQSWPWSCYYAFGLVVILRADLSLSGRRLSFLQGVLDRAGLLFLSF
ncbi:hypothetical protein CC79DRAFT_582658 [Sarocladium strictum]